MICENLKYIIILKKYKLVFFKKKRQAHDTPV